MKIRGIGWGKKKFGTTQDEEMCRGQKMTTRNPVRPLSRGKWEWGKFVGKHPALGRSSYGSEAQKKRGVS